MDLYLKSETDQIQDLQGKPLHADAAILLKSLDKLLTLGAYYSTGHEQYRIASEQAATAISQAIRPRASLALEITSEGLMIADQKVHPHHRNVRQIYDLLVPLNIARLQIDAQLTALDLRQALEVLQDHKLKLGQSDTFHEVVIHNLPPTVQSISRSVLEDEGAGGRSSGFQDLLAEWEGSAGQGAAEDDHERLAREFMELVNQILSNLEETAQDSWGNGTALGQASVSREELDNLREALKRLIELNPSPRQLLSLMDHARSALELSLDTGQANLVFSILRKDMLHQQEAGAKAEKATAREINYALSTEELIRQVDELAAARIETPDPVQGAVADHLGMCLYLLVTDPSDAMRRSLETSLSQLFARPRTSLKVLEPVVEAIVDGLDRGFAENADHLIASVAAAVRQGRPEWMGDFWERVQQKVRPEDLTILWPHLVNDLLLGLGPVPPEKRGPILKWAGSLSPEGARGQLPRLIALPGMKKNRPAADIFKVRLTSLHCVYTALAETELAAWLGRSLHASMKAKPFNRVVAGLMAVIPQYQAANLGFYLEIISRPDPQDWEPELKERAALLLMGLVSELPRSSRHEPWVPTALAGLAQLQVPIAQPLLQAVRTDKRWFFFMAWPEACRQAATDPSQEGM